MADPISRSRTTEVKTNMARWLRSAATLALIGAAACAAAPAAAPAQGAAQATQSDGALLYVCNQDDATVAVVDIASRRILRTVDLKQHGFSANAKPHHVAVEPDGSFWYVSLIGDSKVLKFDRNDRLVGQVDFETPGMLALHPTDAVLYVGRSMSAVNPPQRIGVIRTADMSIDEVAVFFPRPHALAVHPSANAVYTASLAVNQLGAVDAATERLELTSLEGAQHAVVQFAVSPDGTRLVGTTQLTGRLLVFDLADPLKPKLLATPEVGAQPWHLVFSPDGRYVWFGSKMANTITAYDVQAGTVTKVIEGRGIAQPHGAAISPDGRWVFISNNNKDPMMTHGDAHPTGPPGSVVVIDTRTLEIADVIEVGHNPTGLGAPAPRR